MFYNLNKKLELLLSKIKIRTLFIILLILFGTLIISLFTISRYKAIYNTVYEERMGKIKYIADFSLEILKDEDAAVKANLKTLKQAQTEAIGVIKDVRFENNDYIWVNNYDGKMLYHPISKMIGKNILQYKDPNGYNFGRDIVEKPQKDGYAYVKYLWPKPFENNKKPYPKISYVIRFAPWHWIIGTGIYTDDINMEVLSIMFNVSIPVIAVFLIIILFFRYIILTTVISPIEELAEKSLKLAQNDLSTVIPGNHNDTEFGKLYNAFNKFVDAFKEKQNNENKLSLIHNNITDAILTVNNEGTIQSTNPVTSKMFEYTQEEIPGMNINALTSPVLFGDNIKNKKLHKGKYEVLGIKKDETFFNIEVNINEIIYNHENLYILLIRDITEQKEIEKMKNEFVSVVSHELRTPLTSIRGSLGLLLSNAFPGISGKVKDLIEIAHNNSLRLINIINDILDIEKIAAGEMEFHYENANILKIIEDTILINRPYADKFKVQYKIISNINNNEKFYIDTNRFTQVLTNLLSNATKFSPENDIVSIILDYTDERKSYVRVSIVDKGPGIPTGFADKIFNKFTQADSSDARQKGGTGLGLSICKSLVEEMRGKINFRSKRGEGTTFYIEFPLSVNKKIKFV